MLMKSLSKILSRRSTTTSSTEHDPSLNNGTPKSGVFHSVAVVKSQIPVKHCVWLLITVVLQILILFTLIRSASVHERKRHQGTLDPECQYGFVYVYELPPMFNTELVVKCHELDPWKKARACSSLANGGLGPKANGLVVKGVVPKELGPAWYWTDKYTGDLIYHKRMLNHKCRTLQPEKATAFYVPFYAGLDIGRFLFSNYTSEDRDRHSEMVLNWLSQQPYFVRSNGADHFIMLGRLTWDFRRLKPGGWGSSLLTNMPLMKNLLRLSVEKHLLDFQEESVPYPTTFHPRSESDIVKWQEYIRGKKRTKLFSFVGGKKNVENDFRTVIMDYCTGDEGSPYCRSVDCSGDYNTVCSDGIPDIMDTFLDSVFCLQPRGNGITRRSMFDCMLAGSIPVYFWEGTFRGQYEWHLPWTSQSFSVFIDRRDVRRTNGTVIRKVLESMHKDKIKELRENIINLVPKFVYASPTKGLGPNVKDAFDITLERVLKKFNYYNRDRSSSSSSISTV